MAISSSGDIRIGGKDYLLRSPGGYNVRESFKSAPRLGGATDPQFRRGDNWTYWGQSDWIGEGEEDWLAEGPFFDGYGVNLSEAGKIKIAKALAQTQADANNTGGYVAFTDGTAKAWFMGKTNGTAYHTDGSTWTTVANALGSGVLPVEKAYYKGKWHVGASNGKLFELATTTFTDKGTGGPTTNAYPLASYKGKLYVGYANKLYSWDGTTWTELFAGNIDGTPTMGAVGNSYLYMVTAGPNAKVLLTDGNQLHHLASIPSDYTPYDAEFLERLYIVGGMTDDSGTAGQFWRLGADGLFPVYDYADSAADNGIRSMILDKNMLIWGANQKTGIGVFDPALDIYEDTSMGFYVSSVITSVQGIVHGITQLAGNYYVGIQGQGIYKQTTPGAYKIVSSLFNFGSKNINKTWGFAEIHHTALAAGQTVVLKTMKDGSTEDSWGTSQTIGDTSEIIAAPANYKSPYLQYVLSGTANGSDLSILDISLSFIETSDNPKKEWDLVIVLEGGPRSNVGYMEMRDGSRTDRSAAEMLSALNALWNTKTTFQDIDGTEYNVIMKAPTARAEDIVKDAALGSVDDLVLFYRVTLVEL